MEQSRHFYLTLPSDEGGSEFGVTNTNASYRIRLPHPIHLDLEQEWEVAMVSVSFPLRNHQEYMFSHFWLGSAVAKMGVVVWYLESTGGWTSAGIEATVTMADIIDPYLPPKGGRQFMERLIFALRKSLHSEALKGRSDYLPPASAVRWAASTAKDSPQGKQRFKWTDRGTLIIEGSNTYNRPGDIWLAFDPRLAEFIGLIETGSVTKWGARIGRRLHYYYPNSINIPLSAPLSVEIIDGRPRWIKFGKVADGK